MFELSLVSKHFFHMRRLCIGVPSVRYGHAAVFAYEHLIITHGYKYAHHDPSLSAHYMHDTWRLDPVDLSVL